MLALCILHCIDCKGDIMAGNGCVIEACSCKAITTASLDANCFYRVSDGYCVMMDTASLYANCFYMVSDGYC